MNAYIVLMIILLLVGILLGYFFLTVGLVTQVIIMYTGAGAIFTLCIVVAFQKKIYSTLYPAMIRIWEERYDQLIISKITRGRKIGKDTFETVGGTKFPAPDRKYIVYGKDNYIDMIKKGEDYFPMAYDKDTSELRPISQNNRRWLAVQIQADNKASEPKLSKLTAIMQVAVPLTLSLVLLMAFLFAPEYLIKSEQYWKKFLSGISEKEEQLKEFVATSPIVCQCGDSGKTVKPEPPPG